MSFDVPPQEVCAVRSARAPRTICPYFFAVVPVFGSAEGYLETNEENAFIYLFLRHAAKKVLSHKMRGKHLNLEVKVIF